MALKVVTPPQKEPVSLEQAKQHLRVDFDDDDSLIQSLITTAREHCETFTLRALAPTTFEFTLDAFPGGALHLPRPPLVNVESVIIKDKEGVAITLDSEQYIVDAEDEPGKIVPIGGQWPHFEPYPVNAVRIRYTAGYDDGKLPKSIQQAMLLLIGHWYENREATIIGNISHDVSYAVDSLLWPHRVWFS